MRTDEGFTLDDFKQVVNNKVAEWKGTDMEKYLRPETLFGTKFEGYLNQESNNNQTTNQYTDAFERLHNRIWKIYRFKGVIVCKHLEI